MGKKKTAQKAWSKIVFGILFIISCFVAMYILVRFYEKAVLVGGAAALLLISAFLFLNAIFDNKEKLAALQEEEEAFLNGNNGELSLKIAKHMKEVEKNQKEMLEVLKSQSDMMQSKLSDVQREIHLLSEKQISQTKSVIKYNKENARQLAISERETLEYVMCELKDAVVNKTFEDTFIKKEPELTEASEPSVEDIMESVQKEIAAEEELPAPESMAESMPEEEFPSMESIAESMSEEEFPVMESIAESAPEEELPSMESVADDFELPELPEDLDLASLFDIPELDEEMSEEEAPAEPSEPAPAAASNAMMTQEEIENLLKAMQN